MPPERVLCERFHHFVYFFSFENIKANQFCAQLNSLFCLCLRSSKVLIIHEKYVKRKMSKYEKCYRPKTKKSCLIKFYCWWHDIDIYNNVCPKKNNQRRTSASLLTVTYELTRLALVIIQCIHLKNFIGFLFVNRSKTSFQFYGKLVVGIYIADFMYADLHRVGKKLGVFRLIKPLYSLFCE